MVDKFPEFDVYQLGKYNKERSIKRKAKKAKQSADKQAKSTDAKLEKPTLTIKQMIRQLHIAQPPLNVMCILGKKYPAT
jgi:telomerase protein component 1